MALIAVAILTSMVFWMKRAGRTMKGQLHASIDRAFAQGGTPWALVGMAFLAVLREGLESLFFLLAAFQQTFSKLPAIGAVTGLAVAIALGIALYKGAVRMDLRRFFQMTGILIIFVAAGLVAGALKSLHEAGLWNHLQTLAFDWTQTLPVYSVVGSVLSAVLGYNDHPSVGEVLVYFAYLLPVLLLYLLPARHVTPQRT